MAAPPQPTEFVTTIASSIIVIAVPRHTEVHIVHHRLLCACKFHPWTPASKFEDIEVNALQLKLWLLQACCEINAAIPNHSGW